MQQKTPQESFWEGAFGNDYIARNRDPALLASKIAMFSRILASTSDVGSFRELGANIGLNIIALRSLRPRASFQAIEINEAAFHELSKIPGIEARRGSLFDLPEFEPVDLSFTAGVLIHLNPDRLKDAYTHLYEASRRYVMVAEYYNPVPVELGYRGHEGRLFKRDFAGEIMDAHPDLRLIDYGFCYRRDPTFPADDLTWFLMEKR